MKYSLYTQDYSTYKRIKNESDFILLLNNEELTELVHPSINNLKESLYILLCSEKKEIIPLGEIPNEDKINLLLKRILTGYKHYDSIKNYNASEELFSSAYEKFFNRLFTKDGFNDEKYLIQSYIQNWIAEQFAISITKDYRFSSFQLIRKLLRQTEILHNFYSSYEKNIPSEWVDKDMNSWIIAPQEFTSVIDSVRRYNNEFFDGYEHQLTKWEKLTPWKFISESTRDSGYMMLNEEFYLRHSVLFNKDINLWIKFWDNLKIPILQDALFHYFKSPLDYILVAKQLKIHKNKLKTNPKHLAILLLKHLFETIKKAEENLSFYVNEDRIMRLTVYEKDETIINEGKEAYLKWRKERKNIYRKVLSNTKEILSYDETSEWVYSYIPRDSNPKNEYSIIYNKEIAILVDSFNSAYSEITFEDREQSLYVNFNLSNFNALIEQYYKTSIESKKANNLLNQLILYVSSEKFYWDNTFSPMYWQSMKNIGKLLSLTDNPIDKANEMIDYFKTIMEGWNISAIDFKIYKRESYVLCGVMLLFEHKKSFKELNEKREFFENVLNHIIIQIRFSTYNIEDYLVPIHLLSLIANQINPSFKSQFEKELIQGIDDIVFVIKILTDEGYKLTKVGSNALKKRTDKEFPFIRRKLLQKNQTHEVQELELLVKKIDK